LDDNATKTSNVITRGTDIWFALSGDNASSACASYTCSEGDNVTLVTRANGTANFTDNGTFVTNHAELTTAPQIANAGDGTYVFLGASTAISAYNARDNATVSTLGAVTAGTANTWCSTSTGASGGYAVIASDNSTAGGAARVNISKVLDNGTTLSLAAGTTALPSVTSGHVDLEWCAITHLAGTFYLALTDEDATGGGTAPWGNTGDNVSVWKSTDLTTWTQIGDDVSMFGNADSIAIATTGTSPSDTGVWVAVNDATNVKLLHFEDIAGGSNNVWRNVSGGQLGTLITTAGTSKVSVATDGTSIIAVSAIDSTSGMLNTKVGVWYNQ